MAGWKPGDRIVLVAVGSPHREAAFEACEFLVDWLKTKAPFWKLEETPAGEKWVGAHEGDDAAARALGEEAASSVAQASFQICVRVLQAFC